MELSQRPRGGYFALTAAERRKNGNIYVNGAILAERKLIIDVYPRGPQTKAKNELGSNNNESLFLCST